MSLAIYDAIGDFYNWQQMPKNDNGIFFGFAGCTRKVLEDALIALRYGYGDAWVTGDKSVRDGYLGRVAYDISASKGADYDGIYKFLNWAYVAANREPVVLDWFKGGEFTAVDYYTNLIKNTISDKAAAVSETIKYGVEYESPAQKTIFSTILPVAAIVGACYLVKKVLD
jgi:hypothetical protein